MRRDDRGVRVRNPLVRRTIPWADIVRIDVASTGTTRSLFRATEPALRFVMRRGRPIVAHATAGATAAQIATVRRLATRHDVDVTKLVGLP
jgi:PH (Pleckstrin Homology) domain-containing protein